MRIDSYVVLNWSHDMHQYIYIYIYMCVCVCVCVCVCAYICEWVRTSEWEREGKENVWESHREKRNWEEKRQRASEIERDGWRVSTEFRNLKNFSHQKLITVRPKNTQTLSPAEGYDTPKQKRKKKKEKKCPRYNTKVHLVVKLGCVVPLHSFTDPEYCPVG